VSFDTGEGWSRDACEDIAEALQQRCSVRGEVPPSLEAFLETHGRGATVQLSLL